MLATLKKKAVDVVVRRKAVKRIKKLRVEKVSKHYLHHKALNTVSKSLLKRK
jgi:hypothetical protein